MIRNLEGKIKETKKIVVDVSPMILASALDNLSPTRLASGDDRP